MPSQPPDVGNQTTILVTGASGYIASQLIPKLLEQGLTVRCLVRNPAHLQNRSWFGNVEIFSGDLTQPSSYLSALQGVSTAYYLVHGMSNGKNYIEMDLQAARDFSGSAQKAGVKHIIYLGGLADPTVKIARHMRSRINTGQALLTGGVPVTEFRAGVIIGPGSISFEMIRYLTEQFPVILSPRWMPNLSQPIAIQNILDYLLAALELPIVENRVFEIGGSEVMSYAETMLHYARLRGLKRKVLILPINPVGLLAYFMTILTPVPGSITRPLVEGLCSHSIVQDESALQVFPHIKPLDYDSAVKVSLERLDPLLVEPVWRQTAAFRNSMKHAGFCILQHQELVQDDPTSVMETIREMYTFSRNYKITSDDEINFDGRQQRILLLKSQEPHPGQFWQEWRVCKTDEDTQVTQTMLFAPKGLPGFLWWYLLEPVKRIQNRIIFNKIRKLIKN
jgi:uncharacterized protein YbjT (DUF2867 family)